MKRFCSAREELTIPVVSVTNVNTMIHMLQSYFESKKDIQTHVHVYVCKKAVLFDGKLAFMFSYMLSQDEVDAIVIFLLQETHHFYGIRRIKVKGKPNDILLVCNEEEQQKDEATRTKLIKMAKDLTCPLDDMYDVLQDFLQ